jgi:hypothetical protein
MLVFFHYAPHPWTSLPAFFQDASIRAGRLFLTGR